MTRKKKMVWLRTKQRLTMTTYQVRWRERIDDRTAMLSKTFPDINEARKFMSEAQCRLGVVEGTRGMMADMIMPAEKIDLAVAEFVAHVRNTGNIKKGAKSPDILAYHINRMAKILEWATTDHITAKAMEKVLEFYENKPRTRFAANRALLRFLRWAQDRYAFDPKALKVRASAPKERARVFWSDEEVKTLMTELARRTPANPGKSMRSSQAWRHRVADGRHRRVYAAIYVLIRLLVLWGLRPKEGVELRVKDWNPSMRMLTVTSESAKNSHSRSIPIDAQTAVLLNEACKGKKRDDHIFLTADGNPWRENYLSQAMRFILKRLGLPGTLYCTRHYAATRLLKEFMDIRTVMEITGHRTLSEFKKYLHVADKSILAMRDSTYANFLDDTLLNIPNTPILSSTKITIAAEPNLPDAHTSSALGANHQRQFKEGFDGQSPSPR